MTLTFIKDWYKSMYYEELTVNQNRRSQYQNISCILTGKTIKFLTLWLEVKGSRTAHFVKGCGMGPWLVLISPCFRENVFATCKIGCFLCSLDNLVQKNLIVLLFGNQISKWRSFEKRAIFDLLFTFSSHQGKLQKFLQHISQTHTRILLTLLTFFLTNFEKKYEFIRYGFSLVWVLVLILIHAILKQSVNNKMVSKI